MIQINSKITICDNSGITKIKCFGISGKSAKAQAKIGDMVIGSIKEINTTPLKSASNLKKGDIVKAIIVRLNGIVKRPNYTLKNLTSAAVLINSQGVPLGTRINGLVFIELRKKKMYRILSIALNVI